MPKIARLLHSVGIFLITVYFVFNGLCYIFNYDIHGLAIDRKISNTETVMITRNVSWKFTNILPFFYNSDNNAPTHLSSNAFAFLSEYRFNLNFTLAILFGLVSTVLATLFSFYDDKDKRN